LFDYLYNTSPPGGVEWMVIANLYGGPGSIINSFPPSTDPNSTSSYGDRDSGYVWQFYAYTGNSQPPFNPGIITFVQNMVEALGAEAKDLPAYAPYADPELSQAEAQIRYWGEGVARLKAIKSQVDPKGILYNPQGF
jgi:FAD/FMN-containing dehydrogenase